MGFDLMIQEEDHPEIYPELPEGPSQEGQIPDPEQIHPPLMRISASTIDRGLAPERQTMQLKSRSKTKPGT